MIRSPGWKELLAGHLQSPTFKKTVREVLIDSQRGRVFPPKHLIFNAFNLCDFDDVKVVIVGNEPHMRYAQANGLAFGCPSDHVPKPATTAGVLKELGLSKNGNSSLEGWAKQGVFLLNRTLTVREGIRGSHEPYNWKFFTDDVIHHLGKREAPIVFQLWGKATWELEKLIGVQHVVFKCNAPRGGVSRKFLYDQTNRLLKHWGSDTIDWRRVDE